MSNGGDPAIERAELALTEIATLRAEVQALRAKVTDDIGTLRDELAAPIKSAERDAAQALELIRGHVREAPDRATRAQRSVAASIRVAILIAFAVATLVPQCSSALPAMELLVDSLP